MSVNYKLDSNIFKLESPNDQSYTLSKINKLKEKYLKKDNLYAYQNEIAKINIQEQYNHQQDYRQTQQNIVQEQNLRNYRSKSPIAFDKNNINFKNKLYGSQAQYLNSPSSNINKIHGKSQLSARVNQPKQFPHQKILNSNYKNIKLNSNQDILCSLQDTFQNFNLHQKQNSPIKQQKLKLNSVYQKKNKIQSRNISYPQSNQQNSLYKEQKTNKITFNQTRQNTHKSITDRIQYKISINGPFESNAKYLKTQKNQIKQNGYTYISNKSNYEQNDNDDSGILTEDQITLGQSMHLSNISHKLQNKFQIQKKQTKINNNSSSKIDINNFKVDKDRSNQMIFGIQKNRQKQLKTLIQQNRYSDRRRSVQTQKTQQDQTYLNFLKGKQYQKMQEKDQKKNDQNRHSRLSSESKVKFSKLNERNTQQSRPIKIKSIAKIQQKNKSPTKNFNNISDNCMLQNFPYNIDNQKQTLNQIEDIKLLVFRKNQFSDVINLKLYNFSQSIQSISYKEIEGSVNRLFNILSKNMVVFQIKSIHLLKRTQQPIKSNQKIYQVKLLSLPNQKSIHIDTILKIQRRSIDFYALRKILKKFYPSVIIPYLQEDNLLSNLSIKNGQDNQKQKLIADSRKIQYFMNQLLKNQNLKFSLILATFLTLKNQKQVYSFLKQMMQFQTPKNIQSIELKFAYKDSTLIESNILKVQLSEHDLMQDQKIDGLRRVTQKWLDNQTKLQKKLLDVKQEELSIYKKLRENSKGLLVTLKIYNQCVRFQDKIQFDQNVLLNITSTIFKNQKEWNNNKNDSKIEQMIFDIIQSYSSKMCQLSSEIIQIKQIKLPFFNYQSLNIKEYKDLKFIKNSCIQKFISLGSIIDEKNKKQEKNRQKKTITQRQPKYQPVYQHQIYDRYKIKAQKPSENITVLKYQTAYFMKQFKQENKRVISAILSSAINIINISQG